MAYIVDILMAIVHTNPKCRQLAGRNNDVLRTLPDNIGLERAMERASVYVSNHDPQGSPRSVNRCYECIP